MHTIKKLLFLLSPKERIHASLLLVMILIMALLDMIGVASILPFMAVLTNPQIIETNFFLNTFFQILKNYGIENEEQFIFVIGFLVFVTLVFSLIFKAIATYFQIKFIQMREYTIGKRLIKGYLYQKYAWFLNRNSADIGKTVLSEVQHIIGMGMRPLMEVIAKGMIVFALVFLLLLADPKLAIIVGSILSISYGLIYYYTKKYLNKIGHERLKNNELRYKTVSEAFGAAKEVKVSGLEDIYINSFSNSAQIFAKTTAYSQVIAQIPRYILESIAFGGILLIILYILAQSGSFNEALPILTLYVFTGYRLMPAVQQIYAALTQLAVVGPSIEKLYSDFQDLKRESINQNNEKLEFKKDIKLDSVFYTYPNASKFALKNANLKIDCGTTVGLIGTTGSGKTTTIDIILGLLEAQKGTLEIDGKVLTNENVRSWQKSIGYVPQNIYLADDTVAANIAFGIKSSEINFKNIEKASKMANIHEFIVDQLPKKYQTSIGERGVRLSGGQRQRIGIARAFYFNPEVLILDEATSALDNETEAVIMKNLIDNNKNVTIIIIAHRLNTLKICDKIFLLENGQLKKEGKFEELIEVNQKNQKKKNKKKYLKKKKLNIKINKIEK